MGKSFETTTTSEIHPGPFVAASARRGLENPGMEQSNRQGAVQVVRCNPTQDLTVVVVPLNSPDACTTSIALVLCHHFRRHLHLSLLSFSAIYRRALISFVHHHPNGHSIHFRNTKPPSVTARLPDVSNS